MTAAATRTETDAGHIEKRMERPLAAILAADVVV